MNENRRFILKPSFNNLSERRLNYKDILIYTAVRSFYNSKDKFCFPSYKTISKLAGVSIKFISESLKRLHGAGCLDIWKVGKMPVKHYYKFHTADKYQKVPYQLFDASDLTAHEKSILLLIREYCDSMLNCYATIAEIAEASGLTYRTIHKQYQSLLLKGYLYKYAYEDPLSQTVTMVIKLSDKMNWKFPINSSTAHLKGTIDKPGDPDIVTMALNMIRAMARER